MKEPVIHKPFRPKSAPSTSSICRQAIPCHGIASVPQFHSNVYYTRQILHVVYTWLSSRGIIWPKPDICTRQHTVTIPRYRYHVTIPQYRYHVTIPLYRHHTVPFHSTATSRYHSIVPLPRYHSTVPSPHGTVSTVPLPRYHSTVPFRRYHALREPCYSTVTTVPSCRLWYHTRRLLAYLVEQQGYLLAEARHLHHEAARVHPDLPPQAR